MKKRPGYDTEQIRNQAFEKVLENLTNRERAVYNMILEFGPVSTEKVAELMDVYPNYITGRVQKLRDDYQLIEQCGETISEKSNYKAALYRVKKFDPQLAFNLF